MSVGSILGRGRGAATARMDSVARFFTVTGRSAINPTTGKQDEIQTDRVTGVPCRFSASADAVEGSETSPGESLGSRLTRELSIPWNTTEIKVGDFLELTTVGPFTDPSLDGVRFRVVDPGQTSQATARRLMVEVDL